MTAPDPRSSPPPPERLPPLARTGRHLGLFLTGLGVGIILFAWTMPVDMAGPAGWYPVVALMQQRDALTIVGAAGLMLGLYLLLRRRTR